jgi:predicted kinase
MEKENGLQFITFVGIPASGKSTLAKEYEEKGYAVLSSDPVREQMERDLKSGKLIMPNNTNLNAMVFDAIKTKAVELLTGGRSVVFDATNLGRKRRMNFKRALYKIECEKICMLFITPPQVCIDRNAKRKGDAKVPEESMYKMLCGFECPNFWEGWDKIIPITHGERYEFDFNLIKDFPQDNPHHTLTLDGHIDAAYNFAVHNGYSEEVIETLRYHDIGKFYTKRFENRRGERTEYAHFYGHENYSAYLYLCENCCGKEFSEEEFKEILYKTNLINCHMRPLNLWREYDSVKEKDKRLFGERFFNDLVNFNKADKAAH